MAFQTGFIQKCISPYLSLLGILGFGVFPLSAHTRTQSVWKRTLWIFWKIWVILNIFLFVTTALVNTYHKFSAQKQTAPSTQDFITQAMIGVSTVCICMVYLKMLWSHAEMVNIVHKIDRFGGKYFISATKRYFCIAVVLMCANIIGISVWRFCPIIKDIVATGGTGVIGILWLLRHMQSSHPSAFFVLQVFFIPHYCIYIVSINLMQSMALLVIIAAASVLHGVQHSLKVFISGVSGGSKKALKIDKTLKVTFDGWDYQQVKSILDDHTELCDEVARLDSILSFPNLIMYMFCILCVMAAVPSLDGNWIPSAVENGVFGAYNLAVLTACCIAVNIQAASIVPVIFKFMREVKDQNTRDSLSFYIAQQEAAAVGMTTGKFFLIDRTFVASLVGAIVTYALIIRELGDKGLSADDIARLEKAFLVKCGNGSVGLIV